MIDWLSGVVFLPHKKLKTGLFARIDVDSDGNPFIASTKEQRIVCEGSYSSSFTIKTCHTYESIQDEYEDRIASLKLDVGVYPFIEFSGNPIKFLQGHNIFGCSDIYFLAYQALKRCFKLLHLDNLIPQLKINIEKHDWRVTCIDITKMLQLDTDEQVDDYIYHTSRTSHIRSGNVEFTKNTLYFGKNSTAWSIKVYNKHKEVTSRSKKHQLPLPLRHTGLQEWVQGQLRIELRLLKKELDRQELTKPQKLKKNIENLFNEYLGRIEMKAQKEIENLHILPRSVQGTYLLWKQGQRLKEILSKPTFYRHRRELLQYGIDINNAPLSSQYETAPKTIKQVLEPREVKIYDIPHHLRDYLVAPTHLRVA